MYYENPEKKASCFLAYRATGVVALRVVIDRQKFEHGLFKWPEQAWSASSRMILPREPKDMAYIDFVCIITETIKTATAVIDREAVKNVDDFKKAYFKSETELSLAEALEIYIDQSNLATSSKAAHRRRASMLLKIIGPNIMLRTINIAHLALIDGHYRDKSKGAAQNMHGLLKQTLLFAIERGTFKQATPYQFFVCTVKKKQEHRPKVSSKAVSTLFEAWLAETDGLPKETMRIFLIQAYTGLRYSDAVRIAKADFERGFFTMKKTARVCMLFMSERLCLLCAPEPQTLDYHQYRWL